MDDSSNNSVITIKNEKGEEKEAEVICTFDSDETKKSYIVFTDYETDESGAWKTYAYSYDPSGSNKNLIPIDTEEEWNTIDAILNKLIESKEENKNA